MSAASEWTSFNDPLAVSALILVALWGLFCKGLALWHSARRGEAEWFVGILLINAVGILEVAYLFGFAKLRRAELFSRAA